MSLTWQLFYFLLTFCHGNVTIFSYSSYNLSGLKVNMLFHFLCLSYSRHIIASPFHIFLVLELDGGRKQIWQVDRCSPYKEAQRVFVLLGKFNNHFPPAWENHLWLIWTHLNFEKSTIKVKAAFSGVLISVYLDDRAFSTTVRPNFWHWEGQISSWSDWRMMDLIWTERWSTIMPMIDQGELMVWSLGGTEKIGGAPCLGPGAVH